MLGSGVGSLVVHWAGCGTVIVSLFTLLYLQVELDGGFGGDRKKNINEVF